MNVGDGSTINEHADLSGHQVSKVLAVAVGGLEGAIPLSAARVHLPTYPALREREDQLGSSLFCWCFFCCVKFVKVTRQV